MAGLSVAWYTWLEQGRSIKPSPTTLTRVLNALRCTPEECTYVQRLINTVPTPPTRDWNPQLRTVLDAFMPSPAMLLDQHWQRLAQNAHARYLNFLPQADDDASILDMVFLHPEARGAISNWEAQARQLVATFRLDSSTYPDDEWFPAKVRELSAASPDFARFWAERQVSEHAAQLTVVQHPQLGQLNLQITWLQVIGAPHLKLLLCTAEPCPDGTMPWPIYGKPTSVIDSPKF